MCCIVRERVPVSRHSVLLRYYRVIVIFLHLEVPAPAGRQVDGHVRFRGPWLFKYNCNGLYDVIRDP